MIKEFVKGKTAVFVDASNIYFSQGKLGWRIDFLKLKRYFEEHAKLSSIYYYTAYDPEYPKQRRFLDFLEIIGYIVRKKKVKFIKDLTLEEGGFRKGNLDVELTIDAVHNKDDFQSFVLLSGDSDFEALIKYMREHKKYCIVVSTKDHVSIELIAQAKFIDLKKLKEEIKLLKK
ncbi:MAG: NYN domain-containing protein [Candidatus Omnitrophica bacterium]|nr:NYN domain-containing protein [Candidatus Omnitrophota bacterium]